MQNPQLYCESNSMPVRDAKEMILKYLNVNHWKGHGEKLLDIGCGPGDITWEILRLHVPRETKIVGADVGENMLKYAAKKYPEIEFIHLDISKTLPKDLIGAFDHVFSNYCLHWIQDQRQLMKNINCLLKPGGDFFACYLLYHPFYDAFYTVASLPKWAKYIQHPRVFAHFQYEQLRDAEEEMRKFIEEAGLEVTLCKAISRNFTHPNIENLEALLRSVNPYGGVIPEDLKEELFSETLQEFIRIIDIENNKNIVLNYDLIVLGAKKINPNKN